MSETGEKRSGFATCVVWFVRVLKGFAILSLLLTMAAFCVIIKEGVESHHLEPLDKAFVVLSNVGFIVFCILLIIAEFEPLWYIKKVYILHYWFGRGAFQIWMGVICIASAKTMAEAVHQNTGSGASFLTTFGQVVGWVLISVGFIFCIMSVLCIRKITGEDDDLEERLLKDSEAELGRHDTEKHVQDALLVANMAMALGLSENDVRKKFAGSNGAKEAQNYAKQQQEKLKAVQGAAQGAANNAQRKASMASNSLSNNNNNSSNMNQQPSTSLNSDGGNRSGRQSMVSQSGPPPTFGGNADNKKNGDGDDWDNRRGPDDDELMKMYYGGGN